MSKDLKGDLELHVIFQVFEMKAIRKDVIDQEMFSVLEELGHEINSADTDDLLEQVHVNVDGLDRTKIGGQLTLKVKYMNVWMMKIMKACSLSNYKNEITIMNQYLQRTHDHIRQGTELKSNIIKVHGEKVFEKEFDGVGLK